MMFTMSATTCSNDIPAIIPPCATAIPPATPPSPIICAATKPPVTVLFAATIDAVEVFVPATIAASITSLLAISEPTIRLFAEVIDDSFGYRQLQMHKQLSERQLNSLCLEDL